MRWKPEPKTILQKFPNQHIMLYQGFTEILDKDNTIEGKGFVKLSWYPSPRITFKFVYYGEDRLNSETENYDLKLTELSSQSRLKIEVARTTHWGNKKNELSGYVVEPFIKGNSDNLSSVVFNIPNFWWFDCSNYDYEEDEQSNTLEAKREPWLMFNGQFIFDYDNWHIVIGTLDNCHELEEKLDDEGGYGITHLCKVEKLDGALFSLDESYKIIKAFCYYLSFARGFWIAPILLSGFDSEGNELFEEWRTPILPCDSYRPSHSWMPYSDSLDIVDIYPGFVDKWKDEVWHITIKNTIEWYIESLNTNLNTGIILVQASLEKIAWTYLKSNECLNSDGFQGIRASNQIRLLLKFLNINIEPLDNYVEVKKKAKELNWDDTIVAVIEVRNAIVHPRVKKSKNSEFLSDELLRETFWIGHNYLEQCLLKLFCSNYPFD